MVMKGLHDSYIVMHYAYTSQICEIDILIVSTHFGKEPIYLEILVYHLEIHSCVLMYFVCYSILS